MSAPKGRQAQPPSFYDDARARLQAEREATQKVTRELHEQVQAARDTLAALDRVMADAVTWLDISRDNLDQVVDARVGARIDEHWKLQQGLMEEVVKLHDDIQDKLAATAEMVIAAQHDVLGLPDRDKTMKIVEARIETIVSLMLDEEAFRQNVADRVSQQLQSIWDGMRTGRAARRPRGQVIVKTPGPGERLGMYVNGQYVEGSG